MHRDDVEGIEAAEDGEAAKHDENREEDEIGHETKMSLNPENEGDIDGNFPKGKAEVGSLPDAIGNLDGRGIHDGGKGRVVKSREQSGDKRKDEQPDVPRRVTEDLSPDREIQLARQGFFLKAGAHRSSFLSHWMRAISA